IEAFTDGPDCDDAVVTLVMRARDGSVAWVDAVSAYPTMSARGPREMRTQLHDWITQTASAFPTTAALPPWTEGAERPMFGDAEFSPMPWFDRANYERLRADAAPTYCYRQGDEALACVALDPRILGFIKVGILLPYDIPVEGDRSPTQP